MRSSIILPNNLESLFIYEAERSGLVKSLYNPADDLYDESEIVAANIYYKQLLDSKILDRQNLFRTLLLFDDVILSKENLDGKKRNGMDSKFIFKAIQGRHTKPNRNQVGSLAVKHHTDTKRTRRTSIIL